MFEVSNGCTAIVVCISYSRYFPFDISYPEELTCQPQGHTLEILGEWENRNEDETESKVGSWAGLSSRLNKG